MVHFTTKQKEPLIQVENVQFTYATNTEQQPYNALTNCNLVINEGEILAVLGSNGSGKTTLAKHLNGLLTPQHGRVLVAGMDTKQQANCWEIRRLVGMVFQNPDHQIVAATVEEDVAFGLENLGLPPTEIRQRVDRFLQLLQLTAERQTPPHMLSGGQKQHLAIAGVLAMYPRCVVLDEPTAMLDTNGRAKLQTLLQTLKTEHHISVVLITHLMEEAALADRVLVLHQGTVAFTGTPQQLFAQPERLAQYRLKAPTVVEMALMLKQAGVKMEQLPLNTDQLVNMLWQLLKA